MFRTEQQNELYDEKSLEAFWAIVKTGRLTVAAQMLDVTQPAISAAIKKLELKLESPLIQRGGYKKIELTHEGKQLYLYAEQYFSTLSTNILYKSSLRKEKRKVGISSILPHELTKKVLKNIASSNRKNLKTVFIDYSIDTTSNVVRDFTNGEYDCIYIPNLSRDVCLSLEHDIHELSPYKKRFSVYEKESEITSRDEANEEVQNFGFISDVNLCMINLLPKPLHKTIIYKDINHLFYEIGGDTNYLVLTEQEALFLNRSGVALTKNDDFMEEEIEFGFCFKDGAESVVKICNHGINKI